MSHQVRTQPAGTLTLGKQQRLLTQQSVFSHLYGLPLRLKINNCDKITGWGSLDGALIRLEVQLCVFPLLQDPVQLLCEGVVER